jgi:hypothetical protein
MYLATLNGGLGKAPAKTSGKPAGKTSAKSLREIKQIYEEGRRRYKDRDYCLVIAISDRLLRMPDLPRKYELMVRHNIGTSLVHLRRFAAARTRFEALLAEPDLPSAARVLVEDRLAEIACFREPGAGIRGLGDGFGAPSRTAVRHFRCSDAILSELSRAAGRTVTSAELRQSLEQAVQAAVDATTRAAAELARGARSPDVVAAFQQAFGLAPDFVPSWRPAGQRWDLGDVVQRRLQRAAEILAGGSLRFSCTTGTPVSTGAPGQHAIALGPTFWQWIREGRSGALVWGLLSPALRIYFGPRLHHEAVGVRRERIPCYAHFVLSRAGLPTGDSQVFCTGTT